MVKPRGRFRFSHAVSEQSNAEEYQELENKMVGVMSRAAVASLSLFWAYCQHFTTEVDTKNPLPNNLWGDSKIPHTWISSSKVRP